jgi:hypothetical protein
VCEFINRDHIGLHRLGDVVGDSIDPRN